MDGSTVPRAAVHSGAMSYVRRGVGRDFGGTGLRSRGFAAGAGRAGRTDLGGLARPTGPAGPAGTALRGRSAGCRGAAGSGTACSGVAGAGANADGDGGSGGDGSSPNGQAPAAGSGAAGAVRAAAGTRPGGSGGRTVTHPAVITSTARVRGKARRNCIRPPCRTGDPEAYVPSRGRVNPGSGGHSASRPCFAGRDGPSAPGRPPCAGDVVGPTGFTPPVRTAERSKGHITRS